MHTSALPPHSPAAAPEADLFADDTTQQPLRLEFTGTLKADAQVRTKPVGDGGHVMTVLCLEVEGVGPGRHCLRAEQIYPESARAQAEQMARTLRKGQQVRLVTSPLDLRLYLPHVERIELDGPAQPQHH